MTRVEPNVVPVGVVRIVEQYVTSELDDAARYENREPLDESGVYSLHRLAAQIYAEGFIDGGAVESERARAAMYRKRQEGGQE